MLTLTVRSCVFAWEAQKVLWEILVYVFLLVKDNGENAGSQTPNLMWAELHTAEG